jgi:hypothetical protein
LFDYLNFRELYTELEKRYILMLIFNEMKKWKKQIYICIQPILMGQWR